MFHCSLVVVEEVVGRWAVKLVEVVVVEAVMIKILGKTCQTNKVYLYISDDCFR